MSNLNVGSIVLFHQDPNGDQPVAYTNKGKAIRCCYVISPGFAKITKIIKEDRLSIMVDAKNVLYDIFMGMNCGKFLKVINHFGYRVGLDRIINSPKYRTMQHQLLAYHPKYKTVIVAQTDGTKNFPDKCLLNFCEINIQAGHTIVSGKQVPVFEHIAVVRDPLEANMNYKMKPLYTASKIQENIEKSIENIDDLTWKGMCPPRLALDVDCMQANAERTTDDITADIIATAHPDCIKIFEGCIGYDRIRSLAKRYEEKGVELWHWDNYLTRPAIPTNESISTMTFTPNITK